MLVREVMTAPAVTVRPSATVHEALRLLDTHAVAALPVVDKTGRVVGVVSEADLVREAVLRDPRTRIMPVEVPEARTARRVEDVMSGHVVSVRGEDDLADAVELLTTTAVKSLPVVERGRVVGVVSRRDVVHLLARDDERIEAEVSELFRSDGLDWWAEVRDGEVTVRGPRSEADLRLARVLAGSVGGVTGVRVE